MKLRLCAVLAAIAAASLVACEDLPQKKDAPKDGPAPSVTVSEPFTHANLTIFLLRGNDTVPAGHQFLTLQEAMDLGERIGDRDAVAACAFNLGRAYQDTASLRDLGQELTFAVAESAIDRDETTARLRRLLQ